MKSHNLIARSQETIEDYSKLGTIVVQYDGPRILYCRTQVTEVMYS